MSWDTSACFKDMCAAFSEFQRKPSAEAVQVLQRQIDVILGITSYGAQLNDFSPKQLIYAESLSALVGIVNEPNLKISLYLKAFMALSQLANDMETKLSLQNNFNLSSSVIRFILANPANATNKQVVLQAMILLEKMTYGTVCKVNDVYMVDLLKYLVKAIYVTASEFCIPSLAVLANLSRNNGNVKSFLKTMPDMKKFTKLLLSYLSNSNKTFSITSLIIMTSLYLEETLGENMFNGQNLINMIRLAFKVLVTHDDVVTRHYSVDLIIDFIRCEKSRNVINETAMVESDIYNILNLLHSTDAKTAVKMLELLIEFCREPKLRRKVNYVFCKEINGNAETQLPDQVVLCPAQSLLHWISLSESSDMVIQANVLSLLFMKEVLSESIQTGKITQISVYLGQVFPVLLSYLQVNLVNIEDAKQIKQRCQKLTAVFEVFATLSKDTNLKDVVIQQIDPEMICSIITNVLDNYAEDLAAMRGAAVDSSDDILFSVFRGLELLSTLKHHYESGLVKYSSLIQNVKLIPLLSHALGSRDKFLVHAALQIIAEGLKVKEFQLKTLGDTVLHRNSSRMAHNDIIPKKEVNEVSISSSQISIASQPLQDISNKMDKNAHQETAAMIKLTEKLKKGLDMKDTKVSDIMDFYEHKLSGLMGRENHIQDLLENKSTALAQTERLLAQYRCRNTQSEAECSKLRSMLKTSELRNESDSIKISEYLKSKTKSDTEMVALKDQVKSLEAIASEYEELRKKYAVQAQKLDELQESLNSAKEEHASLVAKNDVLVKNVEYLNSKVEEGNQSLQELEEKKQTMSGEIKEKEKHIKKIEKSLKDANANILSLETRTQGLEATLSEKENIMSQLQVELEKQSQISAMIHNLTMGKVNLPSTSMNNSK